MSPQVNIEHFVYWMFESRTKYVQVIRSHVSCFIGYSDEYKDLGPGSAPKKSLHTTMGVLGAKTKEVKEMSLEQLACTSILSKSHLPVSP